MVLPKNFNRTAAFSSLPRPALPFGPGAGSVAEVRVQEIKRSLLSLLTCSHCCGVSGIDYSNSSYCMAGFCPLLVLAILNF